MKQQNNNTDTRGFGNFTRPIMENSFGRSSYNAKRALSQLEARNKAERFCVQHVQRRCTADEKTIDIPSWGLKGSESETLLLIKVGTWVAKYKNGL